MNLLRTLAFNLVTLTLVLNLYKNYFCFQLSHGNNKRILKWDDKRQIDFPKNQKLDSHHHNKFFYIFVRKLVHQI